VRRHRCPNCGYVYDEALGDPREGWPAGTRFDQIDPTWGCPDCGVREQRDFEPVSDQPTGSRG
jgi:rubredoxin